MADNNPDLALAEALARAAGVVILPYFRNGTGADNKAQDGGYDPVTAADRAAEAEIRALLQKVRPDDGVLGEEFAATPSRSGRTWVVDPIDGTRAFLAGLPSWGVLVALNDGRHPVAGACYQPFTNEMYSGDGKTARLGDKLLHSRKIENLSAARLSTTDPALFAGAERTAFEALSDACQLRRLGLDCYAYAMVAAGGLDLVVESGLKPYDIQALIPIIEGAGGVVTNWSGGDAQEGGQVIAAANPALAAAARAILKPAAL